MSCYTDDNDIAGGNLYSAGSVPQTTPAPEATPAAADPATAVGEAIELVASPASLIASAVAPGGATSIPFGLAVLGACLVGILWAASVDKGE